MIFNNNKKGIIGHSGSGWQHGNIYETENKIGALCATDYKQPPQIIIHNMQPRSGDPKKGGTGHLSRNDGKSYCLDTGNTNVVEIIALRGRGEKGNIEQKIEPNLLGKSNSLTTVQKDNLVMQINFSTESGGVQPFQQNRVYDSEGIFPALSAQLNGRNNISYNSTIRRLTPIECCRLQTVPDDYFTRDKNHPEYISKGKKVVSESQQYKQLGNGWTIDVITHILSFSKFKNIAPDLG